MRLIDADALKDKLQQHHDFYVMAWGGFGKMPISEKKRVDEITNCIAEVVNAPTIEPKQGEWIVDISNYKSICSVCGANETDFIYGTEMWYGLGKSKFLLIVNLYVLCILRRVAYAQT